MMRCARWLAISVLVGLVSAALPLAAQDQPRQWAAYVMKPDGSQVRKLAQAPGFTNHNLPRWSRDGKRLVYSNFYKVHIVEVEGTKNPQLVPNQTGLNKHPNWSPDGNWIVFCSDRGSP